MNKQYYVYILASKPNGTLYIGITDNLLRRVYEHIHDLTEGFTKRYQVHDLVYYESTPDVKSAISRETIKEVGKEMESSINSRI